MTDTSPAAVERFSVFARHGTMHHDLNGSYVRYSDYAALSAQLAAANARADQARDKAFDEMLSLIMAYAVYTREALERATASALMSNMIAVTRSRMAHDLTDVVLALRDKPAETAPQPDLCSASEPQTAPAVAVPPELLKLTFAIQYNPNCPSPWLVRLVGKGACIDLKPYSSLFGGIELTGDALGFGKTIAEAAAAAIKQSAALRDKPAPAVTVQEAAKVLLDLLKTPSEKAPIEASHIEDVWTATFRKSGFAAVKGFLRAIAGGGDE